jgi:hypothetical protein
MYLILFIIFCDLCDLVCSVMFLTTNSIAVCGINIWKMLHCFACGSCMVFVSSNKFQWLFHVVCTLILSVPKHNTFEFWQIIIPVIFCRVFIHMFKFRTTNTLPASSNRVNRNFISDFHHSEQNGRSHLIK